MRCELGYYYQKLQYYNDINDSCNRDYPSTAKMLSSTSQNPSLLLHLELLEDNNSKFPLIQKALI